MSTTRIGIGGVLVMAAALASVPAWGQVQQIVGGNLMDANPQVGSGGSNKPVQGYVPINGNDIVNGNVGGLKYFHGSVPYRSEYSFGANLPSSSMGNFARQTATGAPLGQVYQGVTQPYYLPSATVSTAQGRVGSSPYGSGLDNRYGMVGGAAYLNGMRVEPVRSGDSGVTPGIAAPFSPFARQRVDPYGTRPEDITALQPTGLYGFRLGPIGGQVSRDPASEVGIKAKKTGKGEEGEDQPLRTDIGVNEEQSTDARVGKPLKGAVKSGVETTPMDELVGRTNPPKPEAPEGNEVYADLMGKIQSRRGATTQSASGAAPTFAGATTMGSPTGAKIEVDPLTGQPRVKKAERSGEFQSTDPTKPFYRPAASEDSKKKPLEEQSTETLQSGKTVDPMKTFVGKQESPFNEYMRVAERQLKGGRYIDAVETYQEARIFSRDNPLTKIGEAHAKLAAGMYVDTAILLRDHIEQQPELAAVRYDLLKFLPEERLTFLKEDLTKLAHGVRANPTASFLLAYVYYQLGDQESTKRELEYWKKEIRRDTLPSVLLRAWVTEK